MSCAMCQVGVVTVGGEIGVNVRVAQSSITFSPVHLYTEREREREHPNNVQDHIALLALELNAISSIIIDSCMHISSLYISVFSLHINNTRSLSLSYFIYISLNQIAIIERIASSVNKLFNSLEGHKTLANILVLTIPPFRPLSNPCSTLFTSTISDFLEKESH